MKPNIRWASPLVLSLALVAPPLPAHAAPPQQESQQQPKTETFVGQVVKARNGQYALLTDAQARKAFYLDDQEKAKQFEGMTVKVTGILEVAKSLIHVSDIQPS